VSKFDAALNMHLARYTQGAVGVSVRLTTPLNALEAAQMQALGLGGADTSRRVLFGTVPLGALPALAQFDKVARLSLDQQMSPKPGDS
jgi:hypothetical protein